MILVDDDSLTGGLHILTKAALPTQPVIHQQPATAYLSDKPCAVHHCLKRPHAYYALYRQKHRLQSIIISSWTEQPLLAPPEHPTTLVADIHLVACALLPPLTGTNQWLAADPRPHRQRFGQHPLIRSVIAATGRAGRGLHCP